MVPQRSWVEVFRFLPYSARNPDMVFHIGASPYLRGSPRFGIGTSVVGSWRSTLKKATDKSQDAVLTVINALVTDVLTLVSLSNNTRTTKLTIKKIESRVRAEGVSFLTKTLPRLGKAFDKALAGLESMNASKHGFKPMPNSKLPRFLGELFTLVLSKDGTLLPAPNTECVGAIREVLYCFYKYELPYTKCQEQQVISSFLQTENDLSGMHDTLHNLELTMHDYTISHPSRRCRRSINAANPRHPWRIYDIVREARILLNGVFSFFDPLDIYPRHGPGVVATKQQLEEKYHWTNVSSKITRMYPFDAYFCASKGHVCDTFDSFPRIGDQEFSARVLLVPKDSRGPRLISCEPVDYQWIQQGLRQAIYRLVESHSLTKGHVCFTDQSISQQSALRGSIDGTLATLDLKEASDRVSTDLVRLLFPEHVYTYLECCRTTSTVLPNQEVLELKKFAPMGSALCFPVMALTIWALLAGGTSDTETRERLVVYGDDVIVPTAYAEDAIWILESFGLKVNRDKSFIQGFFREACGMDAFQGVCVTPVRIRTVWNSSPSPDTYTSWISYANSFYDRRRYGTYEKIVGLLESVYGPIPGEDLRLSCPSLRVSHNNGNFKRRTNAALQKLEYRVRVEVSKPVIRKAPGWHKLLRYFSERSSHSDVSAGSWKRPLLTEGAPFNVAQYTRRHSSKLVWRWR